MDTDKLADLIDEEEQTEIVVLGFEVVAEVVGEGFDAGVCSIIQDEVALHREVGVNLLGLA